ncbi:carboxymuconolactone decarboxylase family protein [Lysobacter niastensis]|uniref:Carboxymuconolactone decarboxylase family protein n=1 Tax=Lysobacter niastensis TaxID=380629 RepID=A0ABS0BAG4_9GAMM|nr:carboxymuconolactone decarboxylase family protein [Lysobacter niastensis]MBF6025278.1 carboxymuconolactone decarboxylase family protein [Lysobacter niastensis]
MSTTTQSERTPAASRPVRYETVIGDVFQSLAGVHPVINGHGLDEGLRHLVHLRASQINACAFCIRMHLREAREHGETQERLDRLSVWRHTGDFSAGEQAALAWTEALTVLDERNDLGALRAGLRQHFSEEQIGALTAEVAMINLWNRIQVSSH